MFNNMDVALLKLQAATQGHLLMSSTTVINLMSEVESYSLPEASTSYTKQEYKYTLLLT